MIQIIYVKVTSPVHDTIIMFMVPNHATDLAKTAGPFRRFYYSRINKGESQGEKCHARTIIDKNVTLERLTWVESAAVKIEGCSKYRIAAFLGRERPGM